MSRIGKKPISIPQGVKVVVDGKQISVTGPLGTLDGVLPEGVEATADGETVTVAVPRATRANSGFQGLARALIANMVEGVTKGYERSLEISGVGYKADLKGDTLTFALGYTHPILLRLPAGIKAKVEGQTRVTITGIDKQLVHQIAARIRSFKEPEPYKGKGVKYAGETIVRKVGKAGAK